MKREAEGGKATILGWAANQQAGCLFQAIGLKKSRSEWYSMTYQPSSMVLFLTICSLNKAHGGGAEYDEHESITTALSSDTKNKFLKRREQLRQLVKRAKELDWQGVPLSELEFNQNLAQGQDFGGHHTAAYYPALRRYEGRFFQTLGIDGKRKLYLSKHHTLFLSGLYGLVRPMEPIQLYSCPVKPQVADLWLEDNLLTEVLTDYVRKHQIAHVFDLTALVAYRNLIDWNKIKETGTDVLHCFDTMSAGDYALVPFGQILKTTLLDASEDTLISLEPETQMSNIVFRSVEVTQQGLPDELQAIQSAKRELPLLQPQALEFVDEVLRGGHPIPSPESKDAQRSHGKEWQFAISSHVRKDMRQGKELLAQAMKAIIEICQDPLSARGDTIKPITQNKTLKGMWRYRFGHYRLVYQPDKERQIVYLLKLASRGDPELYE